MMVEAPRGITDLLAERRDALLHLARDHGAQSVAVFGFGSALGAGSASHGSLRFFSGWDGHESLSLLLVSADGARLLVGSPFMLPLAREARRDLMVDYVPPLDWGGALADQPNGATVATVGGVATRFAVNASCTIAIDTSPFWRAAGDLFQVHR